MNFYASHQTNCKVSIESTGIPQHLNRLLEILLNEEKNNDNPGECLEYLLQHKLLDWLATLANVETPPGMRLVCLYFFKRLLARTKFPLLHQATVYIPVQRLIGLCSGSIPSSIEQEEIKFLLTLCFLVCRYPHLTNVINETHNVQLEPNIIKIDSDRLDTHSVTYNPARKRDSINPLFEPLNTQAITFVNPNLFACDQQRRRSICTDRLKHADMGNKTAKHHNKLHNRKISSRSNESTSSRDTDHSSECPSPIMDKTRDDCVPGEAAIDQKNYENCDGKSKRASSLIDIDNKLQYLEDLRIDIDYRENNDIKESEDSKRQSLSISPVNETSSNLLLDALISYLNSAVSIFKVN